MENKIEKFSKLAKANVLPIKGTETKRKILKNTNSKQEKQILILLQKINRNIMNTREIINEPDIIQSDSGN